MSRKKVSGSLNAALRGLGNTIRALYKLAPLAVVILSFLTFGVVGVIIKFNTLMVAAMLLLVLSIAIMVYVTTSNYGEAALSLAAGLFSVFSVDWTPPRFVGFVVAWFGFSCSALLIGSVRIAARVEDIYREAALRLAPGAAGHKVFEERLRQIADDHKTGILGPVEKANILRFLVFRRLPTDSLAAALNAIGVLSVTTQMDPISVAKFVADIALLSGREGHVASQSLDAIFEVIRNSPAPPADFFAAFEDSRHLLLGRKMKPAAYFQALRDGLENGVAPGDMAECLEST